MNARRLIAVTVLLGTVVAGVLGLSTGADSVPPTAHAAPVDLGFTIQELQSSPFTVGADGSGFTPGGLVRIDVLRAPWLEGVPPPPSGGPSTVPTHTPGNNGPLQDTATLEVTVRAAPITRVPNGHGIVFIRAGGWFDTQLVFDSQAGYTYSLEATDEVTGRTVTICGSWQLDCS